MTLYLLTCTYEVNPTWRGCECYGHYWHWLMNMCLWFTHYLLTFISCWNYVFNRLKMILIYCFSYIWEVFMILVHGKNMYMMYIVLWFKSLMFQPMDYGSSYIWKEHVDLDDMRSRGWVTDRDLLYYHMLLLQLVDDAWKHWKFHHILTNTPSYMMIIRIFMLLFMLLRSDAHVGGSYMENDGCWLWSFYLAIEVFGFVYKCHIFLLM